MKTADFFEEVWLGVSSNKVRSGLTMLGIVIGIASVIAMLAVGNGARAQIEQSIQSIGSNLLLVMPGAQRGAGSGGVSTGRGSAPSLTREDAEALEGIPGVALVSPEVNSRYQVTTRGANTNTQVIGTVATYPNVRNVSMAEGVYFTETQERSRAKVAILGPTTRDDLFGEGGNALGSRIRMNGLEFTVIGVTAPRGGTGFNNQDDVVLLPLSTAQTFLTGSESVSTIAVQATSQADMTTAQTAITQTLLEEHDIAQPELADFSVLNQTDLVSAASSITNTLTALLASIAGISLLVGGIGIMNMMLTTVTERMREIGLRQAIGAERGEIVAQFLGESVLLTVLGGTVGIILGWLIAKGVSRFLQTTTSVTWQSVLLAVGVSTAIGLVFGYYPAWRASRLRPINALRHE